MQYICSQYCWAGVYLYLKNLQTFGGVSQFLGEESRKSMQFVLQEKKAARNQQIILITQCIVYFESEF